MIHRIFERVLAAIDLSISELSERFVWEGAISLGVLRIIFSNLTASFAQSNEISAVHAVNASFT